MTRKAAQPTAGTGGGNHANGDENSNRGVEIGMHVPVDDQWQLESSDQPGMVLVSTVLTGNNYSLWRRFMAVALGAKGKLGFVNGETEAPDEHSPNYSKWKRADCMVFCWITNSLSKEIMEAFIYSKNAKDLWNGLEQVYGQRSAPKLFLVRGAIASVRQGSDSVTQYFTKFMKLWGELGCVVVSKRECDGECDAKREMIEKVMQFLAGLNESYDQVREQLLSADPFPDIYKAHSTVLRVETMKRCCRK